MSKLREETLTGMAEIVRQYVVKRFDENPEFEKRWDTPINPAERLKRPGLNQETKSRSIDNLLAYLYREAKKRLTDGGSCVAVDDETVYGWINHYLEEEGDFEVINLGNAKDKEETEEAPKQPDSEEKTEETKEKPQEEETKPVEAKPEPKKRGRKPKPEPEGIGKQLALFVR